MVRSLERHLFWTVSILAFAVSGLLLWAGEAPGQAVTTWKLGTPIVGESIGPAVTDASAQQMVDGGWNLAWCDTEAQVDVAQQHGLRAMFYLFNLISPTSQFSPTLLDSPTQKAALDALIARVCNNPAPYCHFVADEPGASQFVALGRMVSYLREHDPKHLAYINLYPNYADSSQLGTSDYSTYLSQYINTVHPSLLSYDNYSFRANGVDAPGYFSNLASVSHAAKQAGIPFVNMVQGSSWDPTTVRTPNGNELRYLRYTSLAYGAQGIFDFGYTGEMASADGTPSTLYYTAKTINPQFVAIAQQVQSMHHIEAYHLGDRPPGDGTTDGSPMRLPVTSPFTLSPGIRNTSYVNNQPVRGAVLGLWGPDDELADATCVLVVNLDYVNALNTRVLGLGNLSVFDTTIDTWIAQGHSWADVSLLPGGGVLVGLTAAVPEPSTLVLLVTGLIGLLCYAWRKGPVST